MRGQSWTCCFQPFPWSDVSAGLGHLCAGGEREVGHDMRCVLLPLRLLSVNPGGASVGTSLPAPGTMMPCVQEGFPWSLLTPPSHIP